MSCTYPEKAIVWGDAETTGLVAHQEKLLEVAVVVTDLDLNVLDDTGFQAKVLYSPEGIAAARAGADPFVQDMHERSGLWDACADPAQARPLADVDEDLVKYLSTLIPEPKTARLGGNSVRLDLNFLEEHLPGTYSHLHYRMVDASSWAGPAQWWTNLPIFPKRRGHTAMADILESIAEMRYLRVALGLDGAGLAVTISVLEAAALLGVSRSSVHRLIDSGQLEARRTLGGHRQVSLAAVNHLRAAQLITQG